jgi:hypothetical protein
VGDLDWVEAMVQHPPSCVSELEQIVGRLDVDLAGHEGRHGLMRPSPWNPGLRVDLRAGISQLLASFYVDEHGGEVRRPRDLKLRSFSLDLDESHAALARRLAQRFGPGRAFVDQGRIHTEYGAFFSLCAGQSGAAHLAWERVRSEAALPPEARTLHQDLLATFVDRLVCEAAVPPIAAALEPLAAAVGVEVHAPDLYASSAARGLGISFRCSLPVATLVTAFRWEEPVASLGDHSTSSAVGPLAAALAPPWIPVLGRWLIDVRIFGWPRGPEGAALPLIDRGSLAAVYDLRTCQNHVETIAIVPAGA